MVRVKIGDKKCATCQFWMVDRKIWFWAQRPDSVESASGRGMCPAIKGNRVATYPGCPRWCKWNGLP